MVKERKPKFEAQCCKCPTKAFYTQSGEKLTCPDCKNKSI